MRIQHRRFQSLFNSPIELHASPICGVNYVRRKILFVYLLPEKYWASRYSIIHIRVWISAVSKPRSYDCKHRLKYHFNEAVHKQNMQTSLCLWISCYFFVIKKKFESHLKSCCDFPKVTSVCHPIESLPLDVTSLNSYKD